MNDLEARSRDTGIELRARADQWHTELQLRAVGREGHMEQLPVQEIRIDDNRVTYVRSAHLTEWYLNGPLGIEQGFELTKRPADSGDGPLTLEIAVRGQLEPHVAEGGKRIDLRAPGGIRVLSYGALYVHDAEGTGLPARMTVEQGRIVLRVDDAEAVYPLRIDPLVARRWDVLRDDDGDGGGNFGTALSLDGNTALVGAPLETVGGTMTAGGAYVFTQADTEWSFQDKLTAPTAESEGNFGSSVAVDGDTALVGEPGAGTSAGAAHVFVRSGGSWMHQQELVADDAAEQDEFGSSVSLDGDTGVVGAPGSEGVYVFVEGAGGWMQQTKLVPEDTASDDAFGDSVSISGSRVLGGAPQEDPGGVENAGAAYVFAGSSGMWQQEDKLIADDAASEGEFGVDVSLDGDTAVIGSPGNGEGAAYAFAGSGGTWTQQAKMTADIDPLFGGPPALGAGVALSGDRALVGVSRASRNILFLGPSWTEETNMGGSGSSVALDGKLALISDTEADLVTGLAVDVVSAYGIGQANGTECNAGSACASGHCIDGVCCGIPCGGGDPQDCQACSMAAGASSDGTCETLPSGTTCRPAVGPCDIADTCTGMSTECPADDVVSEDTVCRAADGACDAVERCDGNSNTCPPDTVASSLTVCRDASGPCDAIETCTGSSKTCPADDHKADGSACDAGASCSDGTSCQGGSCTCGSDAGTSSGGEDAGAGGDDAGAGGDDAGVGSSKDAGGASGMAAGGASGMDAGAGASDGGTGPSDGGMPEASQGDSSTTRDDGGSSMTSRTDGGMSADGDMPVDPADGGGSTGSGGEEAGTGTSAETESDGATLGDATAEADMSAGSGSGGCNCAIGNDAKKDSHPLGAFLAVLIVASGLRPRQKR